MKEEKKIISVHKKIEKKKKKNKGEKKIGTWINKYKMVLIISSLIVLACIILLMVIPSMKMNTKIITIDGNDYTKSDFMIYLYSVKYDYFGKDNIDVPEATLNTQVNGNDDMTIREYLKERVTAEIKTAASINKIASDNDIELSKDDQEEIKEEKEEYILSLGGYGKFKKLLNRNSTTEEAYDKMARTDKLYKVILKELYSTDKKNALTEEEISIANTEYYNSYYKISQVILATIDLDTKKDLSEITINQKTALAKTIVEEANNGANFEDLVKKYSENAEELEPPYSTYYKKGELIEELEEAVSSLSDGSISGVIKTSYALHVIKRETLDDEKLEEFYNTKREEKLLKSISDNIEELSIIYQNPYEDIRIK